MAIISQTAIKHSLLSRQAVMSGETQAESEYDFEKTKPICERAKWTQSRYSQGIMRKNGGFWLDGNKANSNPNKPKRQPSVLRLAPP